MEPNKQKLLEMCITNGISLGYHRAFKHQDDPSEQHIKESIENAIWSEIYEFFKFKDFEN